MKTIDQIKPNYGPVYCAALYPQLCTIFQRHGYALSVHGSLARDFDLVAIPWAENVSEPSIVLDAIVSDGFSIHATGEPEHKYHGRIAYTLSIGFGECACDLSFMPVTNIPDPLV